MYTEVSPAHCWTLITLTPDPAGLQATDYRDPAGLAVSSEQVIPAVCCEVPAGWILVTFLQEEHVRHKKWRAWGPSLLGHESTSALHHGRPAAYSTPLHLSSSGSPGSPGTNRGAYRAQRSEPSQGTTVLSPQDHCWEPSASVPRRRR
jgi:hypothetical protein